MRCFPRDTFQRVIFGIKVAFVACSAAGQNQPPQISPLPDRTIGEQTELTFSAVATDSDVPQQKLAFSIGAGAFTGANVNATNGLFTWTPNEAVGPSTNLFSVIVRDDGSPSLSATQRFTVFVLEVNRAPIIDAIADQTVNEGEYVVVSVLANDFDLPVQSLTYLLGDGAPATMSMSPVGLVTWPTDESHGPGTYPITVMVTDNGSPSLTTTQQFTLVVAEVNSPPVLQPVEDISINEGELLRIALPASDPDLPAQAMAYTLGAGAPEGVVIDAATGVLTWTPTEMQGPGSYQIGVLLADNGTPPFSAATSFTVTVNEVNREPEIPPIADAVINVGGFLVFSVLATDEDIPHQTLAYSLGVGAPTGAAVSAGGLFTWTPSQELARTTNQMQLIVSDGSLSATQSVRVVVLEVNLAPSMAAITNRTVNEGELLTFIISATDSNQPVQLLSFSLEPGSPEGATIDAISGVFSWTPGAAATGTTNQIDVVVTDNGLPPLSATQSFNVVVLGSALLAPRLVNPVFNASTFSASVSSLAGRKYYFERNHSGVSSGWQLMGEFPGTGGIITLTDSTATNANSIYRARVE